MDPPSPGVGPPVSHGPVLEDLVLAALNSQCYKATQLLQLPDGLITAILGISWDFFKKYKSSPSRVIPQSFFDDFHSGTEETLPLYKYLTHVLAEYPDIINDNKHARELLNNFKKLVQHVTFQMHVQEPYYSQLRGGVKTVEGRCATGAYSSISPGDIILFNNSLIQAVMAVKHYGSFEQMLRAESLNAVLPGVNSIEEGVLVYRQFYSEEKELKHGVLGIHVQTETDDKQPLTLFKNLLKELGENGLTFIMNSIGISMGIY